MVFRCHCLQRGDSTFKSPERKWDKINDGPRLQAATHEIGNLFGVVVKSISTLPCTPNGWRWLTHKIPANKILSMEFLLSRHKSPCYSPNHWWRYLVFVCARALERKFSERSRWLCDHDQTSMGLVDLSSPIAHQSDYGHFRRQYWPWAALIPRAQLQRINKLSSAIFRALSLRSLNYAPKNAESLTAWVTNASDSLKKKFEKKLTNRARYDYENQKIPVSAFLSLSCFCIPKWSSFVWHIFFVVCENCKFTSMLAWPIIYFILFQQLFLSAPIFITAAVAVAAVPVSTYVFVGLSCVFVFQVCLELNAKRYRSCAR